MTTTLAARAAKRTPADPMGMACWSTAGYGARRRGRLVSWYRGDPTAGAWVLWDDDELQRPRWEPLRYLVTFGAERGRT